MPPFTNNSITNNNTGVKFQNGGTGTVNQNNITGNSTIGVDNTTGVDIDATLNWWGDATGPATVGLGLGDMVSVDVIYCPWLDDVVGSGSNTYTVHNDIIDVDVTIDATTTNHSSTSNPNSHKYGM